MEESHGRAPICVSQKSDPGDDHTGSLRSPAGRSDSADADFCRSDPALRTGWPWLASSDAGNRCLCDGAGGSAFAADEAGGPSITLVRLWLWYCDHPVWLVQDFLVFARPIISYRGVR